MANQHSSRTAATIMDLAIEYLHACNECDAGNGSQADATARMDDIQTYIKEFGECAESVDVEDWK